MHLTFSTTIKGLGTNACVPAKADSNHSSMLTRPPNPGADELVPDAWRVKNANDIVTRVPSLLGYHHIGCEVQMLAGGQLAISRQSSDDLREGAFAADILPKLKGAAAAFRSYDLLNTLFQILFTPAASEHVLGSLISCTWMG